MPKEEGLAKQKKRLSMDLATLLYASANATDRRVSKRSRRLIASERCRALLQEGGDTLAGVVCARDVGDGPRLVLHLGLQRLRPAAVQQPLGGPERLCRAGRRRGRGGAPRRPRGSPPTGARATKPPLPPAGPCASYARWRRAGRR